MKKRLSCLLIVFAMLAGVLTSCGDGSAGTDTSSNTDYNMTLTLWLPTSENTTDEAINLVESAINKITKKNYNTAIEIIAVDEDEYDEAIMDRVKEVDAAEKKSAAEEAERKRLEREAKKRGETLPPISTEATTTQVYETVTGEDGEIEEFYPSVTKNQLDIFCIRGYDNFMYFANEGHLAPVTENLDASSKLLRAYLYPTFINAGNLPGDDKMVYAIGNNHIIGDYTYLLINKEMAEECHYDVSEFETLSDCRIFIEDIALRHGPATNEFAPLLDTTYVNGINFWNGSDDNSQFSVIGSLITDEADPTARLNIRNVFGLSQFTRTLVMMKYIEEQNLVASDPATVESFGVGVIKCDASEITQYEDEYYVKVLSAPRATTDDIYQAMFGVSTYTEDVSRCMDIITLINTDHTVRTLLQYGVQGVHWDYIEGTEDDPCIEIISDDYQMNLVETGNVFLTYPGEGIPMSHWEYGKKQNLDSKLSPYFRFVDYRDDENQEMFDRIDELTETVADMIDDMTAAEFDEAIEDDFFKDMIADNNYYADIVASEDPNSLVGRYMIFYDVMYGGK